MKNFKGIQETRIVFKGSNFFIIRDAYPVSPGHLLIISNTLKKDYFELNDTELEDLNHMIHRCKDIIEKEYNPNGYNIGMNCGEAAGQTVFQFHCHVIPRYDGDMKDPRGGIRHCINGKGYYK